MSLEARAQSVNDRTPDLIADVKFYAIEDGGRFSPALPGWGCPTLVANGEPGWDAWPQLGSQALEPGEERRVGFVFLSPEGAKIMKAAGKFYLWEKGLIGEAKVVLS